MSYQSNLDKLMQMALLEQLNNMVNQINKSNINTNNQCNCDNLTFLQQNQQQNILEVIKVYEEHVKEKQNDSIRCSCKDYTNMFENILNKFDDHIHLFNGAIVRIENKLDELTNIITENRLNTLEKPDRSKGLQQKITSFTGFAKDNVPHSERNKEENIILKIEETEEKTETVCEYLKQDHPDVEEDEDVEEDVEDVEDVEEDEDVVEAEEIKPRDDPEVEDESVEVEEEVEPDDEQVEEEVEPDDEEVEEEVEPDDEEVGTDDEQVEEDMPEEIKEEDKVTEEEEGEEVFEIEIDDVTYFATHEENGILYEVDKDGEVGKKVGIIKDGEPIFS